MDEDNPECFLDGLIQHQRREIEFLGKPKHFTDEVLGALVSNVFTGGKDKGILTKEHRAEVNCYFVKARECRNFVQKNNKRQDNPMFSSGFRCRCYQLQHSVHYRPPGEPPRDPDPDAAGDR